MGRFSCVLFVALCVGAVAVNADPWFPDPWDTQSPPPPLYPAPDTPSPYYGSPPSEGTPPTYGSPPSEGTPPTYGSPPSEGTPPTYGSPPSEGTPPTYGSPPSEGTPPTYGSPPSDGSYPPSEEPAPETPPPSYDSPPYESPPTYGSPPSDGSYPPSEEPSPSPWFSFGIWSVKTDTWPAPYTADMTVGDAFDSTDAVQVYGQVSMLDGLLSKGDDGYSDLLKQGIAALLNAVDAHFKYTEDEIKQCFGFKTALSSESAALTQAQDFEAANEAYSSTP